MPLEEYNFDRIPYGSVSDVFYNKLDKTWAEGPEPFENDVFVSEMEKHQNVVDDKEVFYHWNSDSYRSDEFTSNHDGKHVLFMGCSETEGIGSPFDTVWAKLIYDKLSKNNKLSGYFNLGKAGFGWQKIISSLMTYEKVYARPDVLLVMLPNIPREYIWDQENYTWRYIQKHPYDKMVKPDDDPMTLTINQHRKHFIDFCVSWKLFEAYCKEAGIKLIWSTWNYIENPNIKMANCFNNFIEIDDDQGFKDYFLSQRPDGKRLKHDIERRDGHHGILYHEYWAKHFLAEIEKQGLLNV